MVVEGWRRSVGQGEVRCREIGCGNAPELDRAAERGVRDAHPAPVLLVDDGELGEGDRLGQHAEVDRVPADLEFVYGVVARARGVDEDIRALSADHDVIASAADKNVVAKAAPQGVVALAPPEVIVVVTAEEEVASGAPAQEVGASAAVDDVVAAAAAHDVGLCSATHHVVARAAEHHVAAAIALEHVAVAAAFDDVVAIESVGGVMARAADQDVVLRRRFVRVGHRCLLLVRPGVGQRGVLPGAGHAVTCRRRTPHRRTARGTRSPRRRARSRPCPEARSCPRRGS